MFNNKFNSSNKDPLVSAVSEAMQDGDLRRQAIAAVNEEFGVYSRKALVSEKVAAYDARLEEAYKCMKEGKPLSPKQKKMAALAGNKNKIDSADLAALRSGKKMMEKKAWEEETDYSAPDRAAVTKDNKPSTPAQTNASTSGPSASDKAALTSKIKAMQEAKGTAAAQNMKHKDFKETRHPNPGAVTKAPVPGVSIAEDNLDEVSKGAAISAYREKEAQERDTDKLGGLIKRKWGKETAKHAERAGAQSSVGLVRRGEDRGKEDSIARDRRHPTDRITKSGKVHKQDTATLKGNIKRRLGSHTKPGHLPEETMDEMANSAKSARGKRVAGAVLQRIRAKHMHEDSSF